MRLFIDACKISQPDDIGSIVRKHYIELEMPLNDSLASIVYIIPDSAYSALIATCWDHTLDHLVEGITQDTLQQHTWPTLSALVDNGSQHLYHEGIVTCLDDLDCGDEKWFVVSPIRDISFHSVEALFRPPTHEVIHLVLGKSMQLLVEVQANIPHLLPRVERRRPQSIGYMLGATAAVGLRPW
jgi:hypothetical protein